MKLKGLSQSLVKYIINKILLPDRTYFLQKQMRKNFKEQIYPHLCVFSVRWKDMSIALTLPANLFF